MRGRGIGTPDKPVEAVLVFTDPDDWYLDLQLMTDLLVSGMVPCAHQSAMSRHCSTRCGEARPNSCLQADTW